MEYKRKTSEAVCKFASLVFLVFQALAGGIGLFDTKKADIHFADYDEFQSLAGRVSPFDDCHGITNGAGHRSSKPCRVGSALSTLLCDILRIGYWSVSSPARFTDGSIAFLVRSSNYVGLLGTPLLIGDQINPKHNHTENEEKPVKQLLSLSHWLFSFSSPGGLDQSFRRDRREDYRAVE